MHVTISNRNEIHIPDTLTYTVDDDATAGVNLRGYPILGLIVPVLNNTPTINLEISLDGGLTWLPLKEKDGSTVAISITGGAAAFALSSDELTPLAAYVGHLRDDTDLKVRLALSAAQTADRVFTWIGLG